ncbi:MAG TPA: hypothetical protein VF582_04000, partial [Allosphingosinicella sp.]
MNVIERGADSRVNTTVAGTQDLPLSFTLSSGNIAVLWRAPSGATMAQLLDPAGNKIGAEATFSASPIHRTFTPLSTGGFAHVYQEGSGIRVRMHDESFALVGSFLTSSSPPGSIQTVGLSNGNIAING